MPPKILLVDDDENILFLISLALDDHGFTVHTASTGTEAISLVMAMEFDVVLLDYKLTDYEGLDLAREMRIIRKNTEIIMVTGNRDLVFSQALGKSISSVVLKPVTEEDLVSEIHTVLNHIEGTEAI